MTTITLIETLYDLLRQKVPDTRRMLDLIDQAIAAGICSTERKNSQKIVEGLLSTLEKWQASNPGMQAAIGHCRQFSKHEHDPERFAQDCAPLFAQTVEKMATKTQHSPADLVAQTVQALKMLAQGDVQVAKWIKPLSVVPSSMEELLEALESLGTPGTAVRDKRGEQRLWDNVWRRLEKGLQEVIQDPRPMNQTNALYQKRPQQPQEEDRESRVAGVVERAEDWMREIGRVGQHLDENREKGQKLKTRIDELELAIAASQTAHFIDPRTGLSDHSGFSVRLNRLLERASHLGELFSLGVIRLANYDALASAHSRAAMDLTIRTAADCIRKHLDVTDFVARIAPDRLGILLPKTDAQRCRSILSELEGSLAGEVLVEKPDLFRLRIIGGGLTFQEGMTVAEVLRKVENLVDDLSKADVTNGTKTREPHTGNFVP
ncbi:MAG: diguanylate cyclase [Magnetococcales bacterium]|nr:diguanylate cyclase [Magnetococcales bacterium]HIJ83122.1 GGDEF domain-containing protein [Magnetococcales bacterium]